MRSRLTGCALVLLMLAACGGSPTGSPLTLSAGGAALGWGDGPYGLVLVPDAAHDAASWDAQARTFADDGMSVVAVGSADRDAVLAALTHLLEDRGLERAALLGAGTGGDVAIRVAAERPELVDQLIVLSATGDVSGLGELPKLFVASIGDDAAAHATRMVNEAAGQWNELYLAEGDATGQAIFDGDGREGTMEAILRRLDERR